ncbi:glycosyltransferase family 9 protein [Mycolicibacterium sp.]|uniref:glycosyltransferase family 9 protein n=1 Tax=Mycolicibacterium sp. TaxID=2320850 RepID=UPI0028AACB52|nr:glycosyltransferase family 9 protein [Mycolicibacterium sp.]
MAAELHRRGYPVAVTGSEPEIPIAREVAGMAGLPDTAVLAGQLDILDLAALVADSSLLGCGDTGVGHIATATGTPVGIGVRAHPAGPLGPAGQRSARVAVGW